jgi:putative membrane protein
MNGFGLIGIIVLIAGIIYFPKYIRDNRHVINNNENALEILKRRFAKGEISKEEFEEKKSTLL